MDKPTPVLPPDTVINSLMTSTQITSALISHGCLDLTQQLDEGSCSPFAVSNGGFGDVYSGTLVDGTRVAIKVFRLHIVHDQDRKHLKHAAKELHTWSKCKHPNILRLLGLVEFKGQIGMVSPWVDSGNVRSYVIRYPSVNRRQLCYAICDGLAYLHCIGIIHGDLKGANVLVSNDGIPLLSDFGNSVLSDQSLDFTNTTTKSNISPRWTAPEVLAGSVSSSYSADIFALGMTILEALTGKVPYHELQKEQAVFIAIFVSKKIPARPEAHIPTNGKHDDILWTLLLRCWAYEPEDRPKAELVRDMMSEIAKPSDNLDHLMEMATRLDPTTLAQAADEGLVEGTSTLMGSAPDGPEEEVDHK